MQNQASHESQPQFFVARLHRNKIETYERIHANITKAHTEALRCHFLQLDIFRLDDILVMVKRARPGPDPEESDAVKDERQRWRIAVGECFAEFWRPAEQSFDLNALFR